MADRPLCGGATMRNLFDQATTRQRRYNFATGFIIAEVSMSVEASERLGMCKVFL